MSANITTARAFVKLAIKKAKLESDLKKVKKEMADKEADLIDYFERNGISNLKAGDRTVYTHRQLWASLKDREEGVAMLKKHGYGDLVSENANSQSLSAWVRELAADVEKDVLSSDDLAEHLELPEELRSLLKISEKVSLRVKKG